MEADTFSRASPRPHQLQDGVSQEPLGVTSSECMNQTKGVCGDQTIIARLISACACACVTSAIQCGNLPENRT